MRIVHLVHLFVIFVFITIFYVGIMPFVPNFLLQLLLFVLIVLLIRVICNWIEKSFSWVNKKIDGQLGVLLIFAFLFTAFVVLSLLE